MESILRNNIERIPQEKRKEFLMKCISRFTLLREYIPGENVIKFYSNAVKPYYLFSNFALIEEGIEHEGLVYISTEHAFQAQKYIKDQRVRFSVIGDLGNPDSINLVFKPKEVESKRKHWYKKDNVGIIAKMATNKKIGKELGLIRDESFVSSFELWRPILLKKYTIPKFRDLLLSTGDNYLLEFDKGAQRSGSFWGGLIVDGKLYGDNTMGKYLMKIRDILKR